jgi:hypothetical protein
MPHNKILHSMELLATKVAPAVKKYATQQIETDKVGK